MSNWKGDRLPDGVTWCNDVEKWADEWEKFTSVVCKQFDGVCCSFCPGVGVYRRQQLPESIYIDPVIARVIYRLATGEEYEPPND